MAKRWIGFSLFLMVSGGCSSLLDSYDSAAQKLDSVNSKVNRARSAVSTSRSVGRDVKDLAGGN